MTEAKHLNQLQEDVEEASRKARDLTEGLVRQQLLWKPAAEKWSIAECFEHLILTGEAWGRNVRAAIRGTNVSGTSEKRDYRPTLFGRFFLGTAGANVRVPIPTHPMFEPRDPVSEDAPGRFLKQQEELLQLLEDSAGVHLRATRVPFPQWSWLSLRLGEALTLMVDHQHRHLRQAEHILEQIELDSAS